MVRNFNNNQTVSRFSSKQSFFKFWCRRLKICQFENGIWESGKFPPPKGGGANQQVGIGKDLEDLSLLLTAGDIPALLKMVSLDIKFALNKFEYN